MRIKRQSTPARSAAARANGAKSRGPTTDRGKANSSKNSFRHGLRSRDPLAFAVNFNIDPTRVEEAMTALIEEYATTSGQKHVVRAAAELVVLHRAIDERFNGILKRHERRDRTGTCDRASIRADADFIDRFLPLEKRIAQQLEAARVRLDTLREQRNFNGRSPEIIENMSQTASVTQLGTREPRPVLPETSHPIRCGHIKQRPPASL